MLSKQGHYYIQFLLTCYGLSYPIISNRTAVRSSLMRSRSVWSSPTRWAGSSNLGLPALHRTWRHRPEVSQAAVPSLASSLFMVIVFLVFFLGSWQFAATCVGFPAPACEVDTTGALSRSGMLPDMNKLILKTNNTQ